MGHVGQTVDEAFIRRAVEIADLNAVRVALYQLTQDPALATLPVAAKLDDQQKEMLISKAVAWLKDNAGYRELPEPPEAELRRLMEMAAGGPMGDLEFEARRDLPAFKKFPFMTGWTGAQPKLPEGFKVAVIGSGFAGIAAGVQLSQLGIPYVVLERRPEPGGVWSINRYPDVRVDTSSITYEHVFVKKWKWSEHFGRGPEVRNYLLNVSKQFGVYENTRFNHDLQRATFDEKRNVWVLDALTPEGQKTIEANVVITCVGLFNNPKIVNFEGREKFKGTIVHPSRWPDGLELKGKRVAIIGNGSTGIQMVQAIAEVAKEVKVYQRTAQWISPRAGYGKPLEPELAWLLENLPGYWNWGRYTAIAALFDTHDLFVPDPDWIAKGGKVNKQNDQFREFLTNYIKTETGGRQDLIDKLIPDYAPMSRRPVVDNGWYRALTRDNVELVTDGIKRFTEKGIETVDGKERELDIIVTATGFEVMQYLAPTQWLGRGGLDLHKYWDSIGGARAYNGMMVPNFPNLFMVYGPNSQPISGGTSLPMWLTIWGAYAAQCTVRVLEAGKSRVEVKEAAYKRYNDAHDAESRKLHMVRPEHCAEKNYYVDHENQRLQTSAPWYSPDFHRMCTKVDWNELEIS